MRKQFKAETIAQLLGDKYLKQLEVALLRQKAMSYKPVSLKDVEEVYRYIVDIKPSSKSSGQFRRVAFKWIMESKWAHRAFLRYLQQLMAATKPKGITVKPKGTANVKAKKN